MNSHPIQILQIKGVLSSCTPICFLLLKLNGNDRVRRKNERKFSDKKKISDYCPEKGACADSMMSFCRREQGIERTKWTWTWRIAI